MSSLDFSDQKMIEGQVRSLILNEKDWEEFLALMDEEPIETHSNLKKAIEDFKKQLKDPG